MNAQKTQRILFVYEPAQIEDVVAYLKSTDESHTILALDFWTEYRLAERGIAYTSIAEYPHAKIARPDLLRLSQDFGREWYRLPEMSFFEHLGVRIGEALEPMVSSYAQRVLYFIDLIEPILRGVPAHTRVIIPHSRVHVAPLSGPLVFFEHRAPLDVARHLASKYGCVFETIGTPRSHLSDTALVERRTWRHGALTLLNRIVEKFVRERPVKIFGSEYWSNIASIMTYTKGVELIMMDRNQVTEIPFRTMFANRIRFLHARDRFSREVLDIAASRTAEFRAKWTTAAPIVGEFARELSKGIIDGTWWTIIEGGVRYIVESYAERVVADAEGIKRLLEEKNINLVLLRASIGGAQHHFFTTSCIAHTLGIPSIELQHGGGEFNTNDPGARLSASYLAAYGNLTRDLFVRNFDLDPERIRPVGSPRFDEYIKVSPLQESERKTKFAMLGLDSKKPVILAAVPAEDTGATLFPTRLNSYDVRDFFLTFKTLLQEVPNVQVLFKFRGKAITEEHRRYIAQLFPDGGAAFTDGDFFSMLRLCDIVVAGKSTVNFETIIGGKPLVCFPWKPDIHAEIYAPLGPILDDGEECIALTKRLLVDAPFRKEMLERQSRFLAENFSFDGHAAQRVAALFQERLKSFPAAYNHAKVSGR